MKRRKRPLAYDDQMRQQLKYIIASIEGVESADRLKWIESATTSSYYLYFDKDGIRFTIRVADHATPSECIPSDRPVNVETSYLYRRDGSMVMKVTCEIDATGRCLRPDDIATIISKIGNLWKKYSTSEVRELIRQYAQEHGMTPVDYEDIEYYVHSLTLMLMEKYDIADEDKRKVYNIMAEVCDQVLYAMLPDDDD